MTIATYVDPASGPAGWIAQILQFGGRLHPLLVHLPVGALASLLMYELAAWFLGFPDRRRARGVLLGFTLLTSFLSLGSGWLLAQDGAHAGAAVAEHRNMALLFTCALACAAAAELRSALKPSATGGFAYGAAMAFSLILLFPAAHLGGSLTHGEGFLFPTRSHAPVEGPVAKASDPSAAHFIQYVAPVLEAKCIQCHGADQQKGKLALHEPGRIRKGGKSGPVLNVTDPASSLLLRRIQLPATDRSHMPPPGKPQLTTDEAGAIVRWIELGGALPGQDSVALENGKSRDASNNITVPAPGAPAAAVAALEERFVHVQRLGADSEWLWIDFSAAARRVSATDIVQLLTPVAPFVSDLGLSRADVDASVFALAASMPALRRIEIRDTKCNDADLAPLKGHASLRELVATKSTMGDGSIDILLSMPALQKVYLWGTAFSEHGLLKLQRSRPRLHLDRGTPPHASVLASEGEIKLSSDAPVPGGAGAISNAAAATSTVEVVSAPAKGAAPVAGGAVNSVCPVSGSAVNPQHTIQFEGRTIAFCCPNCPAKFQAAPENYRDKLK